MSMPSEQHNSAAKIGRTFRLVDFAIPHSSPSKHKFSAEVSLGICRSQVYMKIKTLDSANPVFSLFYNEKQKNAMPKHSKMQHILPI